MNCSGGTDRISSLPLPHEGAAGFSVIVWGPEEKPLVLDLVQGEVADDMDFDNFGFQGIKLAQPADSRTAKLSDASEKITLEFDFTGIP